MTKARIIMFAALAAIVTFGVCGQAQAQAAAITTPKAMLTAVQKTSGDVSPDGVSPAVKLPGLIGGELAMGVLPPLDGSSYPYWPCLAGGTDCSTIPGGGWVSGYPFMTWSLSSCNGVNCGQLTWWFQDNTTDSTDDLVITLTAKQGANFIYNSGPINFGPNPFSGDIVIGTFYPTFGPGNCAVGTCATPVSGKVTLGALAQVGKIKATSTATMYLQ